MIKRAEIKKVRSWLHAKFCSLQKKQMPLSLCTIESYI